MHWTVIGHEQQKKQFEQVSAHAYLFTGPQGIGKRMFADELTAGLCACLTGRQAGPDLFVLGPDVEQARDMKRWAYARPLFGMSKVVVVDDAERMSIAAANTLLKVLEEPPAYLHFFLISSQPGQVLPTIASRCQEVAFQPLDDADMQNVLAGLKIDADDRQLLSAVAAGRPGIALTLVRERKLPIVAQAIADLEKMLKSGVAERIAYAKQLADDDNVLQVVSWWLAWMHAQLPTYPNYAPVVHSLLDLHAVVADTKYNRRLALEKFLLEVSV